MNTRSNVAAHRPELPETSCTGQRRRGPACRLEMLESIWNLATVMMQSYAQAYPAEDFQIVALEKGFQGPLINPATGAESRSFLLAGKVDGIVQLNGQHYLLEHKTAGTRTLRAGRSTARTSNACGRISRSLCMPSIWRKFWASASPASSTTCWPRRSSGNRRAKLSLNTRSSARNSSTDSHVASQIQDRQNQRQA